MVFLISCSKVQPLGELRIQLILFETAFFFSLVFNSAMGFDVELKI